MSGRRVYSEGTYAHYVTFSCYKRRKLLHPDVCKRIVVGNIAAQLRRQRGTCVGFVVMPEHVHAVVWFPDEHQISAFMDKWKDLTSRLIADAYRREFSSYWSKLGADDSIWQARYYDFNIYSDNKLREKLDYMHQNPVREGLVTDACDWAWSSARWWHRQVPVGIELSWPP